MDHTCIFDDCMGGLLIEVRAMSVVISVVSSLQRYVDAG